MYVIKCWDGIRQCWNFVICGFFTTISSKPIFLGCFVIINAFVGRITILPRCLFAVYHNQWLYEIWIFFSAFQAVIGWTYSEILCSYMLVFWGNGFTALLFKLCTEFPLHHIGIFMFLFVLTMSWRITQ